MQLKAKELERYTITVHDVKDQLKKHIYQRSLEAFELGDQARDELTNGEQVEARGLFFREKLVEAIGGLPPCDTPLNPKITGSLLCTGYHIEKIIFESRKETFVTANMYIPEGITAPRGAVLFLCGHDEQAKHSEEYQTVCQHLVHAGLVVLAMDPIGQGERLSYYEDVIQETTVDWGIVEHDYAGFQCLPLGDGIARYFVHDAIRAVDYLCTRSEVDPARIGVTGNSGGGTQTALMMVCDPRIAAAAPATFIMNRQTMMQTGLPQDSEQIWCGMTALGFDHEDILIGMVPRPVLVLAVTYDFFPIEGTRRTTARAKRFWDMYGKGENFKLVEDISVHRFTDKLAREAAEFFSLHLLEQVVTHSDGVVQPIEASLLWCTSTGQIRSEYKYSRAVYEENVNRLIQVGEQRDTSTKEKYKSRALGWLKEKVHYSRKPCDLNPRITKLGQMNDISVQSVVWWSQTGIFNHAFLFRNLRDIHSIVPVTVAIWDQGTHQLSSHMNWIQETCNAGRVVLVLDVSGVGALLPNWHNNDDPLDFYGAIYKLTDDLFWLDDSLAALRIFDVVRALDAVELLPGINPRDIRMYAHGRQGIYAQLASLLDHRVKHIEVECGMKSVADWVRSRHYDRNDIFSIILPGMLQYFDLPDCVEWFENR